jgi:hypothetical protein
MEPNDGLLVCCLANGCAKCGFTTEAQRHGGEPALPCALRENRCADLAQDAAQHVDGMRDARNPPRPLPNPRNTRLGEGKEACAYRCSPLRASVSPAQRVVKLASSGK